MTRRGWALFVSLGVIWGVPYAMIRIAVRDFDPVVVAGGRVGIAALLLLPIALYTKSLGPVLRRWPWLLAYTLVEISGPWFLLAHAETTLNSSTVGLLVATVPLVAMVLLAVLGHDAFDRRRVVGLLIGLGGVVGMVGLDIDLSDYGALAAVGCTAVGYAIGPIIVNRRLADLPPMGVVTASLLVATAGYAPFVAWRWPERITAAAGWSVLGLAVLCTAVAFLVFFALIGEVGPARTTVITYLNPAVALLIGVALLDEPLTAGMAIGFPLVILGSVLATARTRTRVASEPQPVDTMS
ncbi:DMT family transporter [Nocardia transvalensis]|uniref:DMT family transporter n=1 Tax=Nocardia transvalensis TaxID=37333 RepID=UPI001894AD49|nr:DMT family transporter [Nocardia transvalensis]MBF6327022.1 DMT family transporter [Nocardia transvalensis]